MNILPFCILCTVAADGNNLKNIGNCLGTFVHVSDIYWKTIPDRNCSIYFDDCIGNSFTTFLKKVAPRKPDFVLWSSAGGKYFGQVANQIKKVFKNTIVLPSLPPVKVPANESQVSYYKNMSIHLGKWLDSNAYKTFWKFGYYSRTLTETGNLMIVVLNTAMFCNFNELSELDDPAGQWTWLNRELLKARRNDKKVYFLLSATPGVANRLQDRMFTENHNKHYINVVQNFSDVILGQFGGYEDGDKFYMFQHKNGQDCGWLILSPPFSKSVRLYVYNTETAKLLDYIQYKKHGSEWEQEYNFTFFYSVSNLSIASFQKRNMSTKSSLSFRSDAVDLINKLDIIGLQKMFTNAVGFSGHLMGIFPVDDEKVREQFKQKYPANPPVIKPCIEFNKLKARNCTKYCFCQETTTDTKSYIECVVTVTNKSALFLKDSANTIFQHYHLHYILLSYVIKYCM